MVSEDFLIIFLQVYGSKWPPGCGGSQFEPKGHGWQDLRSEPILNIEAVGVMVSEDFLKLFPIIQ